MKLSPFQTVVNDYWAAARNAGSILRHEDFKRYQEQIITVRRENLVGVTDLLSRGLVASEEFETTIVGFEQLNEFREAIQTMGAVMDENNDTDFTEVLTPLPITHTGWSIQPRQNKTYKRPIGLSESTRSVSKKLESMLFNGAPKIVAGGNTIYGYLTHPNRITDTISDWSNFAVNGDKIVPEFTDLINQMETTAFVQNANSIMAYIAPNINGSFNSDYKAEANKTVRKRLVDDIDVLIDIKVSHEVPDNTVVLTEMSSMNVEMSRASDIQTVPHTQIRGPLLSPQNFTTFAVMTPIFHADRNGTLPVLTAAP